MKADSKEPTVFQETETVELKLDYTESLRKDIIAFANSNGGTIYIGISDDGSIVGVSSVDQMIQSVANMARDSIRPDVTMFIHYESLDVEDKKIVNCCQSHKR